MLSFLKRLFDKQGADTAQFREELRKPHSHSATDLYFCNMSQLQEAMSKRDFENAANLVRESLIVIPGWVKEECEKYSSFRIGSIPALEEGGTALALVGDDEGLAEMGRVINSVPELKGWSEAIEYHQQERRLFERILKVVSENPGCLQTEIKSSIGEKDGHLIARLIYYLDKAKKVTRVKTGRTYRIFPAGSYDIQTLPQDSVPAPPPKRNVDSHRKEDKPPNCHEIDISSLDYVPLPRSPLRWEEKQVGQLKMVAPTEHFEVREGDWRIIAIEKIPMAERPDPAFRMMYPTKAGIFMLDDLGNAAGLGQIEAAVLCYDRSGTLTAKERLLHDIYRANVHPGGLGLIAMSREYVVHAYDEKLKMIFETALLKSPEIRMLRKRFEIQDDQLKNHIRCVAISRDAGRYLFTAVDEAWCIDSGGRGLWGAKLPIKDGWTRVTKPSLNFGTRTEVGQALALMNMALPFSPTDLKQRYRELAKQWHPDLNPGDPNANEKMKHLNSALEILTGVDATMLPRYTNATFTHEMGRDQFEVGGHKFTITINMQMSEIQVSDWIYAANFASNSDQAYLAGYSGRIILVDANGKGVRAYDIGSVPRRIIDTGNYLYLLTDTRLYVLRDDALHALIDTFSSGELVVAQNGFGLLEEKSLRWFTQAGDYLGCVLSKDPIRRVYWTDKGMIVESRQRRAVIQGVPDWWK